MGIYPQPNSWLCGPFALKHAMLALGVFDNEWAIARAAGTNPGGTDERELARAARQYECTVRMIRVRDEDDALDELVHHLEAGMPTLLCIEQWDHWVTAMFHDNGQFVLFDSKGPHVIRLLSWEELRPKWAYREDADTLLYDLHPVASHTRRGSPRARFTVARAAWLAERENLSLARQWSDYAAMLLAKGRARHDTYRDMFVRPLSDVIDEHEDALVMRLHDRTGGGNVSYVRTVLKRLRFVADTYELDLDTERQEDFLASTEDFVVSRLRIRRPVG